MAPPRKIVALELEDEAIGCRIRGRSAPATRDHLNGILEKRGSNERLTEKAVKRYWQSVKQASVAVAHRADVVERNAQAPGDIAQRVRTMLAEFDELYEQAKVDYNRFGERQWSAVTALARQLGETLKLYIDLMAKVENVEKARAFRQSVVEAVRQADPATAQLILESFRAHEQIIEARFHEA